MVRLKTDSNAVVSTPKITHPLKDPHRLLGQIFGTGFAIIAELSS